VTNQVTHFGISEDGTTLLTVDVTLLQLTTLGRNVILLDHSGTEIAISQVFTLKFWSAANNNTTISAGEKNLPTYELNALIVHLHGRIVAVAGLILSHNGNIGVTSSIEENCFRVWKRQLQGSVASRGKDMDSSLSGVWKCVFHLQTPAGFQPPSGPMAFSPDDSLLAVANGNVVTLWDYEQSALLRSIGCGTPESFVVKELYLDETGRIIVTSTVAAKMECHSIFPQKTQLLSSSKIWEWSANTPSVEEDETIGVSTTAITCYLASSQEFAIAVSSSFGVNHDGKQFRKGSSDSTTKLFFIDAQTGIQNHCDEVCNFDGTVQSMCSYGEFILLWMDTKEVLKVRHRRGGNLGWVKASYVQHVAQQAKGKSAALDLLFLEQGKNKKSSKRTLILSISDDLAGSKKRQTVVEGFGIGQIENSELPLLTSTFFRDFVGQRLPRMGLN
jgi:hypothetical protein